MKAVLLAAGRGSRMGESTRDLPKCMARLGGRSLLDWQLEALRGAGVDEFGIVRGYRAECIRVSGATYFLNAEWRSTNMVLSLVCASAWLKEAPCLVSYTDIVYPASTAALLAGSPGDIAISYDARWLELWSRRFRDPLDDAESFRVSKDGRLLEIGARAKSAAEIEGQYMGLSKFTPRGWRAVERILAGLDASSRAKLDMTALLALLLQDGFPVRTVRVEGRWAEVDSEGDLKLYEGMLADEPGGLF